ncbi:paramyosin-like [Argiope bruennichi]|uniref:paramyosin-like n=1 Tax=Argiope bruennichi TaxID=94029 RepID=UPI00249575DE|nr:paramyosin-like [Argiope bruennichi]XP_055927192.1 paramyosin-like [Argiope bruennichi]
MGCGGTKPAPSQQNAPRDRGRMVEGGSVDVGMVIPEKGAVQMKPVEITVETLQKYLDLEKEIQLFEKRHVLDNYQLKSDQLEQLEKNFQALQDSRNLQAQNLHQLQAAIDRTNGTQSLKQFLFEKSQKGEPLNEDEEEYVDLLNRQEVIERQLESTIKQRDLLKEEIQALTIDGELLQKLYAQRDELLDSIFGGAYGSERENRLEKEYDFLQERKNHIDQAHFKWKQAQIMVKQACAQLGLAVQKWKELLEIPENDMEQRYYLAAETRNNLVAASQNLQGAHGFLPNITFPYCAEDEVDTLNKAVTFIFTDMQTPERYEHALNCYHTTYRRSGALRQWFDQVLNTTISKDLAEITEESKAKAQELRQERIHLIKQKVKEITGKDVDFDARSLDTEAEDLAADEQVAKLFEAERLEGKSQNFLTANSTLPPAPTPVPVSDLAPMPTNEEIFGKIDELRKKHAVEMADFEKAQTINKARTTQGLQEKLQARRSRRSRMQNHEREIEALQSA